MHSRAKAAVFTVLIPVLCFAILGLRNAAYSAYEALMADEDRYYLPPPGWMRAFCLGYNEAAADLIWAKTIVYFGGKFLSPQEDADRLFTINYLETASDLDPRFRKLYVAGHALTLFQNRVATLKSAKAAISLLERGMKAFPDDGEIVFDLGFMHYYEMRPFLLNKDKSDPVRRYHRETGAMLIRRSALLENAPPYAAMLTTTLLRQEGFGDLIVEHLKAMLVQETNENTRRDLEAALRREIGKAAERDIRTSESFISEWKASMPYIPYDLYLVLRPEVPIEEVLDPLYFTNRLLGLDEENLTRVDSQGFDGNPEPEDPE